MQIDNIHQGQRFIIGGCSPFITKVDIEQFKPGVVIGVNRFPLWYPCDYWLAVDGDQMWSDEPEMIKRLDCPRFVYWKGQKPVPFECVEFKVVSSFPSRWRGELYSERTSPTAAISLALLMGASEIVLYGFDFVGEKRADGEVYPPGLFTHHLPYINAFLSRVPVPVYKTNPESLFDVPLLAA